MPVQLRLTAHPGAARTAGGTARATPDIGGPGSTRRFASSSPARAQGFFDGHKITDDINKSGPYPGKLDRDSLDR